MIATAMALFQSGRLADAETICRQILVEAPKHVDALILLGVLKQKSQDFESSISLLDKAIKLQPNNPETRRIRSLLVDQYSQASIQEALAMHQRGELAAAEKLYHAVLDRDPQHLDALNLMGALEARRKNHQLAINYLDRALAAKPDFAEAHSNRGNALQALNRFDEALASFDQALRFKPDFAEAHNNRGNALQALKRFDEALVSYNQALRIKPDYAEAYDNRGSVLQELKRFDDALASHDQALRIKPDFAEAYSNRGIALQALRRFEEALASCNQALQLKPDYAEAHYNQGIALQKLRRLHDALASYDQALRIRPDHADSHWNQSLCRLQLGDYATGWAQHEWRWKRQRRTEHPRHVQQPLWLGAEDIAGKTILLWSEQGFGDTLQFCRYASFVAELGATVYLEVPASLKSLLAGLDGVAQVFGEGEALPEFDCQCPIPSLPLAFKCREETICGAPYISASARYQWIDGVQPEARPKVGIAWSGNAAQENDHNRSMTFSQFQSLLPRGLEVVCLQKDIRDTDSEALSAHPAIHAVNAPLEDFSDTAALINELDLVVTVDTSVAHLAGAMGKEVWILLSWAADWRWLLDRSDSPWYDSATLFRQPTLGDWESVAGEVRRRLCDRYGLG